MTRYHLVSLECDRYARRAAQATLCCSLRYDCLSITRPAEQNTRKQIGPSNSSSNAHASSPRCRRIAVCRRASLGAGILWLRVLLGPLLGRGDGRLLILFPALGDVGGEGVVGVGGAEQGLDGEEDGPDLQRGGPVVYRRLCQYACPVFVGKRSGETHSSGRRGRCGPACPRWGGRSLSGSGSWAASWDSRRGGRARA